MIDIPAIFKSRTLDADKLREYGFSYSDIVVVTYVLSFYSDSNNAGKNPFYYTAMDGWEGSGCTMFYDLP